MSNPYKLTSQVSLAPDPQLSSMMEKFKQVGDAISFSVVFNEVQRRKEVRDAAQSKMMGGPKPQVADQLIQESKMAQMPAPPQGMGGPQGMPPQGMPPQGMGGPQGMPPQGMPPQMAMGPQGGPPQGLPEGSGIGQLPAPNMQNMAGGGIVSFAGDEDSYVPFDSSFEGPPDTMRVPNTDYLSPETETEDDPTDYPTPEFDFGDPAGKYRSETNKLFKGLEAQNKEYETKRSALGKAYANAEERDAELSQRYADEERFQKGMPWINAGLALMQSSGKGISGLADAGTAGISALVSGREKLAALKDKQRDYMQTVAEARRAEELGQLDKFRELQASLTAQRANIEGVAAQLEQGQADTKSRYAIAGIKAGRKGLESTPSKEAGAYLARARLFRDAADDPKNAAQKNALLAEAEKFTTLANDIMYAAQGVNPKIAAAKQKSLDDKAPEIYYALSLLESSDSKSQAMGEKQLQVISGSTGVPIAQIKEQFGVGSTGGGGSGVVADWDDYNPQSSN
jgi:hypothetical protein